MGEIVPSLGEKVRCAFLVEESQLAGRDVRGEQVLERRLGKNANLLRKVKIPRRTMVLTRSGWDYARGIWSVSYRKR